MTIVKDDQPALDAEQADSQRLKHVFRRPPGIGALPPARSTLLVGARGSGKTMLLRAARHDEQHFTIYGDLRKILSGVSADIGGGGLSFQHIRPSEEGFLQDKTVALLALWAARESKDREVEVSSSLLARVMPTGIARDAALREDAIPVLEDLLPALRPSNFRSQPAYDLLCEFLDDLTVRVRRLGRAGLLLALDRAEEVPFPSLVPILRLLDQNHPFRAVVACRPGVLGPSPELHPSVPRAGDHFDVCHLGHAPYSSEWSDFRESVLRAWIPRCMDAVPADVLQERLKVSRDSLRVALELVYESVSDVGRYNESESLGAVQSQHDKLLDAAQGSLRTVNDDVPRLLKIVRDKMDHLPVLVVIPDGSRRAAQLGLLDSGHAYESSSRIERVIRLGLRAWLFSVPDGTRWTPFVRLDRIELNPIYLWKPGDQWR